ncbi:MAG: DUF1553 domain-containing protein [Fuerstiella sp.]|nr:DUF1553 domain-containing protein [Fuerstiella sp.]
MTRSESLWFAVIFAAFCFGAAAQSTAQTVGGGETKRRSPELIQKVTFAEDILPLLRQRCFECHQGSNPVSGYRLDHYAKMLGETDGIPFVVPGESSHSRLIQVVTGSVEDKLMPPADAGPELSSGEIDLLRAWIDQGAAWDERLLPDPNRALAERHWAFRPVQRPPIPDVASEVQAHNRHLLRATHDVHPIDAFVGARHSELKLNASQPAPKRTLFRRLHLVLHGLLPSPDQVNAFINDGSPGVWASLVDRVLDSEHFGERIARHWLDTARWAESEGFAQNNDRPFAWRYRDYVIDSFNGDKPYTEFLRQQIAGDELVPYSDENLIATGYLAAARISADDLHFYRVENDMYTDIVNTLSSSILGLTVGCAQCHDHKFDPISQRDFYRLQAFFKRGLPGNVVLADTPHPKDMEKVAQELLDLDLKIRRRVLSDGFDELSSPMRNLLHTTESERSLAQERTYRPARIRLNIRVAGCNSFRINAEEKKQLNILRDQLNAIVANASQTWAFYSPVTSPHQLSTLPMEGNFPLMHDRERLADRRSYLLARGQIFEPVAIVTPGWPSAFGPTVSPLLKSRPRSALCDWLTDRDNPLTARVWVNRIWQMHFGRGLVETPGNFGIRGSPPTHPKLLDWLASELMDHDWSTKHIHRLIVTSRTWQQSSKVPVQSADPENRYLWRWPRRRLEAEAIHDSMLAASGELDRTVGGVGVPVAEEATTVRRGMYLFQKRDAPPAMQQLFDGPTAMAEACIERHVSTSALQSLYLLNNDFARNRSRALADRISHTGNTEVDQQIVSAFELILGRPPDEIERDAARSFFAKQNDRLYHSPGVQSLENRETSQRQVPTEHLSLWLRADAGVQSVTENPIQDNDRVFSWVDQTAGNNRFANNLSQLTAHRQPRFVSRPFQRIGGLPVIRFTGGPFGQSDHFLSCDDQHELTVTDGYTLFAIVRFNGSGQRNEVVFVKGRNGGNDIATVGLIRMASGGKISVGQNIDGEWADRIQSSHAVADGVPVLIVVRWNGLKLELDVWNHERQLSDETTELKGIIDAGSGGRAAVGGYVDAFSDHGERLNGDLGEILFYRAALSDAHTARAVAYLQERWLQGPEPMTRLELFSQALLNLNEFCYIE